MAFLRACFLLLVLVILDTHVSASSHVRSGAGARLRDRYSAGGQNDPPSPPLRQKTLIPTTAPPTTVASPGPTEAPGKPEQTINPTNVTAQAPNPTLTPATVSNPTCSKGSEECGVSRACGRERYESDSSYICCPSGQVLQRLHSTYCTDQGDGAYCFKNDLCASKICANGKCVPDKLDNGELCDQNGGDGATDCVSGACGREKYDSVSSYICCSSGQVLQRLHADSLCASNICVAGTCLSDKQEIGEACDNGSDCVNEVCGKETYDNGSPVICCPSGETIRRNFVDWCNEQPAGAKCFADSLCASSVCTDGICQ